MSGGSLGYFYSSLEEHIGDFMDKELDDLVKDLVELFHDREWFLSGDTCEGNWNESRDAFKKKWFTKAGRHERIETYLDNLRNEVLMSLGLANRYCQNCKHWEETDTPYGECDSVEWGLMHRCESCEKYEGK